MGVHANKLRVDIKLGSDGRISYIVCRDFLVQKTLIDISFLGTFLSNTNAALSCSINAVSCGVYFCFVSFSHIDE